MTDEELINALRSINHMNVDDCFLQSHFYSKAADRIEQLVKERDAIREAALREAAAVAQRGSDILGKRMRDAKDKKEKHDWQSMLFAAVDIQHAILALIGEKK
jgi:hypothetical protein